MIGDKVGGIEEMAYQNIKPIIQRPFLNTSHT